MVVDSELVADLIGSSAHSFRIPGFYGHATSYIFIRALCLFLFLFYGLSVEWYQERPQKVNILWYELLNVRNETMLAWSSYFL